MKGLASPPFRPSMEQLSPQLFWVAFPAVIAIFAVYSMGLFGGNQFPVEGRTVLLTGASEGMGLEVAKQLAAKGANIVIVSRTVSKLKEAIKEIEASAKFPGSQQFHYISADVSSTGYAAPVVAEAVQWNGGKAPDIVWCLAGIATAALFLDQPTSLMRRHMDVNFHGSVEMCHAILKEWLAPNAPVEKTPKHLILTSSVAAFWTVPGYGFYGPSKAALRCLIDDLAQEVLLYPQNVKTHLVSPGTILSPSFAEEERTKPEITKILEQDDPRQTPEAVARLSIRSLEKGHHYVTVSWLGDLMKWSVMGGIPRNNWIIDTIGAWLVPLIWIYVQFDFYHKLRSYGKKHGHPSLWKKHEA
ncbi:hypothetical protein S7711_07206 [Stachybotrys chartarum IBT 7711]|uniref:3-dehydrosphinganine reductase n=1 Tax=Stachybotrys chartarum (strain CBS 109288 / IBT 7711) TaxID=1280523 RepID=A0A084AKJ6_STACB|nr:hypothetical protein S7711_07206 [Stachybotrys chartarum IBT 7711]